MGSAGTGGAGLGEDGGWGRSFVGDGFLFLFHTIFNFPYFLCFHYTGCVWRSGGGATKPHHDGDLRRNRSGGLFVYIAMI